jgi:CBS domain-containing protein
VDFQLNLESEPISQAHPARPTTLEPQATVRTALRTLAEQRTGALLICRDKRLLGIFTERDALRLMATNADLDAPLEEHMRKEPITLGPSATLAQAVKQMSEGKIRRLPIVDSQGIPVGMLKVSGIVRYLVEHFPKVVYTLPPAPHHKTKDREGA